MQPRTQNDALESQDMHVTNQQLWLIIRVYNKIHIAASLRTNQNAAFVDTDSNTYEHTLSPGHNWTNSSSVTKLGT